MDYEILFRKLLPIETALPSAVVLTQGATAYTPTASPLAMDASATSSFTHAWASSNSNDTLDSGGTTASPTFTLESSGFRWIRYTFTDSNGNSNYRVIAVWTVPKDYSGVVQLGFGSESGEYANIAYDSTLGWSATIPAFSGITSLLDKTFCVLASDEYYNDTLQSIRSNIDFVGYLQNESTQTQGSEQYGSLSETQFTIEGFGHQLARQNITSTTIVRVNSTATQWDDIQDPTPARFLTYHLTEKSTLFNLCSMTIPSDDANFIGDDLTLSTGKALDDMRFIAEVINAVIQFDSNGKLDFCRDLIYLDDTARDAADTVVTFEPSDLLAFTPDFDYSKQTASLQMTGGAYDSGNDVYDLYEAYAPAVARLGEGDDVPISNQVLETDSTPAQAVAEIAQRAANYFAAHNPAITARVTLKDEWRFLVPDVGTWFKFNIAITDTIRGIVFGASDRWQLINLSYSTNNISGTRQVDATFRHETQSTGAMIRANPIQNATDANILVFPPVLPYGLGGTTDLTGGSWYDSQDPAPPSAPNAPDADCELGGIRVRSGASYSTDNPALNGERIASTVRGTGILRQGGEGGDYDFTTGSNGWSPAEFAATSLGDDRPANGQGDGATLTGSGWEDQDYTQVNATDVRAAYIYIILGAPITVLDGETVTVTFDYTKGTHNSGLAAWVLKTKDSGSTWTSRAVVNGSGTTNGTDKTLVWTVSGDTTIYGIAVRIRSDTISSPTGDALIKSVVITGVETIYGDAFYYWLEGESAQAYDNPYGLLIEGSQPTSIPPYNPEHEYSVFDIVTSGPVLYEFDSPYGNSNAENWSVQIITCFLGVP
jgi:hypothetical protein